MLSRFIFEKYQLLKERLHDPHMRKMAVSLLLGKMIGLALVLALISKVWVPSSAYADATPALPPPHINAINTVWTLVAAYLVFCMQVGFVMLESNLL